MKRSEAAKIYDRLPKKGKNMPRQEFIEQCVALTDSHKMAADAMRIARNKHNIDDGFARG